MELEFQSPIYRVIRQSPEIICPARATPKELKFLSPLDELRGLRLLLPVLQFYRCSEVVQTHVNDPVNVIRKAIGEALVHYYPLAGRLREAKSGGQKLAVDCTGEGIIFTEADADVRIDEFGDVIYASKSDERELLFDEPMSSGMFDSPLLYIQVTRLACGGFVMGTKLNHMMLDGIGIVQFLNAVSEFARGFSVPSIHPVWERHLISARDPPQISSVHREFSQVLMDATTPLLKNKYNMIHKPFVFKNSTISSLSQQIFSPSNKCSSFDLIAAIIWRARTVSLMLDPSEEVRLHFAVESRNKFSPPIPLGYYGNVVASPVVVATAGQLQTNPIEYTVELIKNAKARMNEDYIQSMIDFAVINDGHLSPIMTKFILSDGRRLGLNKVDYGWGKPELGGTPRPLGEAAFGGSICLPINGDDSFVVTMCLPELAMEQFVKELTQIMKILEVRAKL